MVTALDTRAAELELVAKAARDYAAESKSKNTRRAYRSDWRRFESWCSSNGFDALPAAPATVAF